jgi:hypothetical protein
MAHSIDELLLFDKELRLTFQYSHPSPSILHVLLEEVRFHKWLTLEKTCEYSGTSYMYNRREDARKNFETAYRNNPFK